METDQLKERVSALREQSKKAAALQSSLKKIHTAVVGAAFDQPTRQRAVLKAAYNRLTEFLPEVPRELRKGLQTTLNEITSLQEGISAGLVSPEDMQLLSAKDSLVDCIRFERDSLVKIEAASYGQSDHSEDWARVIKKNAKFKADIAKLEQSVNKNGFGFARVPVSLTFVRSAANKHSSVGFLSLPLLEDLGFNADMIGGYAVIYGQVVMALNPKEIYDTIEEVDEKGVAVKTMKPKIVKDRVIRFSKDVGGIADKKRNMTTLDLASSFKSLLEAKTNQKYAFVSEKPYGYKGNTYFWLMPDRDLSRLARAFPGKHVAMDSWGFAF